MTLLYILYYCCLKQHYRIGARSALICALQLSYYVVYLREVHCFVYLSQQMVFRHKVVYAGYFTLASFFLFSVQHFITLFYYGNL